MSLLLDRGLMYEREGKRLICRLDLCRSWSAQAACALRVKDSVRRVERSHDLMYPMFGFRGVALRVTR